MASTEPFPPHFCKILFSGAMLVNLNLLIFAQKNGNQTHKRLKSAKIRQKYELRLSVKKKKNSANFTFLLIARPITDFHSEAVITSLPNFFLPYTPVCV